MKKSNLSIGMLLVCSVFLACSKSSTPGGTAGTSGGAGTSATTDGGSATLPDGGCAVGAYARPPAPCSCQSDEPNVCAGVCTNTMNDDANCGACGNACKATSTCTAGKCGPEAKTVVPANATGCQGLHIALSGGTIYYTDLGGNKVSSVGVGGGASTTISAAEKAPGLITVNGTTAYWINVTATLAGHDDAGTENTTTTAVIRKSVAGAAPTDLVTETNLHGGIMGLVLSADGGTLYYSADTHVRMVPTAGSAITAGTDVGIEDNLGVPLQLGINGTRLAYGTGGNGDVDVISAVAGTVAHCGTNKPGTDELDPTKQINCVRLARSQGGLLANSMILKTTKAYWADGNHINSNDATPAATQSNHQIASSLSANSLTALAGNDTAIYFGEDGLVEKAMYIEASPVIRLARGQAMATNATTGASTGSIALDATSVYWSTSACGINSTGL